MLVQTPKLSMLFSEQVSFYDFITSLITGLNHFNIWEFYVMIQVEVARTKASEESTKMYDRVEKAQDESRSLDESLKGLTKELQTLNKEKETVEARRTEAIKKKTKLELDENDFKERMAGNIQSKVLTHICSYTLVGNCTSVCI